MSDYNILSERQVDRIRENLIHEELLLDSEFNFFFSLAPAKDVVIEFRKELGEEFVDIAFIFDRDVENPDAGSFRGLDQRIELVLDDIEDVIHELRSGRSDDIDWNGDTNMRPYRATTAIPYTRDLFAPESEEIGVSILGGPDIPVEVPIDRVDHSDEAIFEYLETIWWESLSREEKLDFIALEELNEGEYDIDF